MPTYTIEIDDERVQSLLQRLQEAVSPEGFTDTMKEIGEDLRYSTRQRFIQGIAPDGSRWPGLAQSTVMARLYGGKGSFQKKSKKISAKGIRMATGMKPLIATGRLMESVNYDPQPDGLVLYVNRQYNGGQATAAVHQTGTHRAGRGRKVTIPARPFLGVSESDIEKMERTVVRAITAAAEGE
jgi:phage gpG-like protein